MIREFDKVIKHKKALPKHDHVFDNTIHYSEFYNVISFKCPCGCGHHVFINSSGYMPTATTWDIELKDGKINVHPSIRMTGGCKSHYFIKDNKIQWCSDSPILKHQHKMQEFEELIEYDKYPAGKKFEAGKIYHARKIEYVHFICPCGCGARESIKQGSRTQIPNTTWKFTIKDGKVTIRPSMYMRDCTANSHYWITDNKIQWV